MIRIRSMPVALTPRLLPLTILLMLGLLVLKSIQLVGVASAEEHAPTKAEAITQSAAVAPSAAPPLATPSPGEKPAEPAERPVTASERDLLVDLRKRREALDAREAKLANREAMLAAIEQRLQSRFDDLKQVQSRLEALEQQRTARDEENWRGLVKVYETMKPREAATIFDDLDLPVLLPVVDRMKEQRAAAILAAMQPDRARLVTTELSRLRSARNSMGDKSASSPKPTN